VFQDYARYQFTVRDVVRMGRPGAHGKEAAALDAAGLTLPLDDQIGRLFPGGRDLSGGQWQRLALARLYYRNADVLVLDEPTSSLDEEGEARTFRELRERLEGRIGIVISHRPSTVRAADRVLTLTPSFWVTPTHG
jgi:ATP-binding cassette subfamily B protein